MNLARNTCTDDAITLGDQVTPAYLSKGGCMGVCHAWLCQTTLRTALQLSKAAIATSLLPAMHRYRHRLPPERCSVPHPDRHTRLDTPWCPARDRPGHDSRHPLTCNSHRRRCCHYQWRSSTSSRCARSSSRGSRGCRQCYWRVCWQHTAAGDSTGAARAPGSQADVCVDSRDNDGHVQCGSCQAAA